MHKHSVRHSVTFSRYVVHLINSKYITLFVGMTRVKSYNILQCVS